jgi:hypothetical protein
MVEVAGGGFLPCRISDNGCTRGQVSRGWPSLELEATDGYRFNGECHSLPCYGMADVRERARYATLEPCPADCDCKEGGAL